MRPRASLLSGLAILFFLVVMALLAPALAPHDPAKQNLEEDLLSSSGQHFLGTDKLGRDVFSRILFGARISIFVGVSTVLISSIIGLFIGCLAGYFGGWVDELLMRVVDILLAFPGTLLAIALTAVLGPGLSHVVLALCLIGWTGYARLARGEVLALRETEFIQATRALGSSPARIMFRHMVPNLLPPLLVQCTFGMSGAILAEGALSFLGLGAPPPAPSWGSMLSDGRHFLLVAPHLMAFPGLAMMVTILGLNLIGDGLRDELETKGK